jgi:hypothetical protein
MGGRELMVSVDERREEMHRIEQGFSFIVLLQFA